jgi:PAS domain S-box-containing protein
MAAAPHDAVRVLCVDDEPGFASLVATQLERHDDHLATDATTTPEAALDRFEAAPFDAVVSDYNMPGMSGLDLLAAVREIDPDVPFLLYTGRGSEEIASDAITMGVTEYVQKDTGTDHYAVLTHRIRNAVSRYHAERQMDAERDRFEAVFHEASDAMILADDDGTYLDVNTATCDLFDRPREDLLGHTAEDFAADDYDFDTAWDRFRETRTERGLFPVERPDGTVRIAEYAATADVLPGEHLSVLRDITKHREHERELRLEQERLEAFAGVLSHDLKNPIAVAEGYVELLAESLDDEQAAILEEVTGALARIDHITDDVLALASTDGLNTTPEPVDLTALATDVWERVRTPSATATVQPDCVVHADESLLERLLTNLLRNTIEHGGDDVTVELGALDDRDGFYLADDGPGIPNDDRDAVFDWQHTTKTGGTGIGLRSVQQVVDEHDWTIAITDGDLGGARFEVATGGP